MSRKPIEQLVGEILVSQELTLSVAESFTGGLIGHTITNVPGSSEYFLGGIISYANLVKEGLLSVQLVTIEKHGPVSKNTVIEMAQGVRRVLGADIGLSASGIAGPAGGTLEKPVGTVWIGLSAEGSEIAWHHHFEGSRLEVKVQACQCALNHLVNYLTGGSEAA